MRLASGGKTLRAIPFTVHVWDFTLPDESHVAAIYDLRAYGRWWQQPGRTRSQRHRQFCGFMAERRSCYALACLFALGERPRRR